MRKKLSDLAFEDSLGEDWSRDLDVVEVALDPRPAIYVGVAVSAIVLVIIGRIFVLGFYKGPEYSARAAANANHTEQIPAPRGIIYDRTHFVLAENKPVFSAVLLVKPFLEDADMEARTVAAANSILSVPESDMLNIVAGAGGEDSAEEVLLARDITQGQVVALKALDLPTLKVETVFDRTYPKGNAFAAVLGYVGLPTAKDIAADNRILTTDLVGRGGVESFYDTALRGVPGKVSQKHDAKGRTINAQESIPSQIGASLSLALDGEFQNYFYDRFMAALNRLGRTSGVGLAMNPQNGEVLALMSFPSFDPNVLSSSKPSETKKTILTSSLRPLFDRAVSGMYNPGSTIKPLVGVAALAEGVIDPARTIFSPGYLDIPNPYDPAKPTRYLDWRYQGYVNLANALAQSSNVYFYTVGGGAGDIKGLGLTKLNSWWQKFNLGSQTGIDLPSEAKGFLPTEQWKKSVGGRSWLLGDTYNVSIGQGDLLLTPIQLLDYIAAIANGGKLYVPVMNIDTPHPKTITDLSQYLSEIKEVQKGMRAVVTAPLGSAYMMHDLPFAVAAKTGTAQVQNNTQETAFFAGYAPYENPQIAILVLVEHSKEGSLNALPIAKEVLSWYYEHRLKT